MLCNACKVLRAFTLLQVQSHNLSCIKRRQMLRVWLVLK